MKNTATATVRVQTDEAALIANLRAVFSDRKKVLAEMMQNARRAKATSIHFSMDEKNNLTIEDNGIGIDDLQNLLFIARSGWDQETVKSENAFGMGWLSSLFSAKTVSVESRGKKICFESEHAIGMKDIPVETSDYIGATRIVLGSFKLAAEEVKSALGTFAKGFPIRVYYNDTELERPDAIDNIVSTPTPIGDVSLTGIHKVGLASLDESNLYFQGLPINAQFLSRYGYRGNRNVIHLDASFNARMPDRDSLIDEDIAKNRIFAAIRGVWLEYLSNLKQTGTPADVVEHYGNMKAVNLLHLLNDVPLVPQSACYQVCNYPTEREIGIGFNGNKPILITQEQVERGEIVVCDRIVNNVESDVLDGNAFAGLLLIKSLGWYMLSHTDSLHDDHWVHAHVVRLDDCGVKLEYTPLQTFSFNLNTCGNVILVDSYKIIAGDKSVEITDSAVAFGDYDNYSIIVPSGTDGSEGLDQITSWLDEYDQYNETREEEDKREFANLVSVHRGEKAAETVQKLLRQSYWGQFSNCHGNSVVTSFAGSYDVRCESLEAVLVKFAGVLAGIQVQTPEAIEEAAKTFASSLAIKEDKQQEL